MSQCSAAHIHCNQIMSYRQVCLKATVHGVCSLIVFLVCCRCILFFYGDSVLDLQEEFVEGVESRSMAHPHSHLSIPEIESWKNEFVGS